MILAALLASSFVSCSEKQNDGAEDTSAAAEETAPEEVETDPNVRLWEGKTFDGYTMHILGRQDAAFAIGFEAEELTGEIVNDAVYNRNIKVEDDLDITLEYVPHIGDFSRFLQDVNNSVIAADGAALDYLSCLSAETVYPAYFENTFQKKYMRSEEDSVMFDFIRSGMEFNFGAVFSNCIANPAHLFRVCINNQEPMASSYRTKEKTYVRKLESFLESLRELQAEQN